MKFSVQLLFFSLLFLGCDNQLVELSKQWVTKEKVFFSSGTEGHVNICMMNTDGSNVVPVTAYAEGEFWGGRSSPDGKKLLYYRFDEHTMINGIYLKDLNGPDTQTPLFYGYGCDFTPDGSSIVYANHNYGAPSPGFDSIFRFYFKDSTHFRITAGATHNWGPRVSPIGSQIVYSTWRSLSPSDTNILSRWDIMIMNIDGSQQEYLLPPANGQWTTDPRFSHDGSRIVFSTNARIRILNLKDRTVSDVVTMQNSINELYPCFSPDDNKIYFSAGGWNQSAVYVIGVDGKNLKRLSDNSKINRNPFVSVVTVYE